MRMMMINDDDDEDDNDNQDNDENNDNDHDSSTTNIRSLQEINAKIRKVEACWMTFALFLTSLFM